MDYRQYKILEYLKENKHAKISELAKKLFVSDATIRRELAEMEKLGLLARNHGGAVIIETADELAIRVRYERDPIDKRQTAAIAMPHLPDFKTVFIDNSSTALILAQKMDFRHKTVVTNGLMLAMELCKREDVTVLMPGGNLSSNTNSLSGSLALRYLGDMRFNLMLCSCTAIDENGSYESSMDQSELKRTVLRRSTNKVLLADKNKFKNTALFRTAELCEYNAVFTNADDATTEPLRKIKNVEIINR